MLWTSENVLFIGIFDKVERTLKIKLQQISHNSLFVQKCEIIKNNIIYARQASRMKNTNLTAQPVCYNFERRRSFEFKALFHGTKVNTEAKRKSRNTSVQSAEIQDKQYTSKILREAIILDVIVTFRNNTPAANQAFVRKRRNSD